MDKWKKEILGNSLAEDVIEDYRELLSVGQCDIEAENIIIEYYMKHIFQCNSDEKNFWLALALIQWEWGRLSNRVREKAFYWLKLLQSEMAEETAVRLKECLLSPMPILKKIPRPRYVSKCPWPVGSLLAYRIISTDVPEVVDSPYWRKYVLLRIVMIKRTPVSRLSPDSEWRESMIVGLYDWFGDSIPDPAIVNHLSFTPISVHSTLLSANIQSYISRKLEQHSDSGVASFCMNSLSMERVETCVCLDWRCAKGINSENVFTYLGIDPKFGECTSDFFKTDITQYSISHSIPFDVTLAKRFEQLARQRKKLLPEGGIGTDDGDASRKDTLL